VGCILRPYRKLVREVLCEVTSKSSKDDRYDAAQNKGRSPTISFPKNFIPWQALIAELALGISRNAMWA